MKRSHDYLHGLSARLARHGLLIITGDNAITYKAQRDKNARELKLANAAITDMQMRQRDVAALDAKYTKGVSRCQSRENDALRDDVAAGRRRLPSAVCQSVKSPKALADNGVSLTGRHR